MIALIGAVFVASVMGSLHCAGMCGAFVAIALAPEGGGGRRTARWRLHAAYNLGRLGTYVVLGSAAGALGGAVDLGGEVAGVQRLAAALAGATIVVFGAAALLRQFGVRAPRAPVPGAMQRLAVRGHRWAMRRTPTGRALTIGLLTTLLPCGWLYAFVFTAAGTGSAATGALTMAVFWLGTLPVMVGVGAGAARLAGALGARLPVVTTLLLIVVGMWTIANRAAIPSMTPAPTPAIAVEPGAAGAMERLEAATEAPPACCSDAGHAH